MEDVVPHAKKKDVITEEERKQGFRIRNLKEINEEAIPEDIMSREYQGTPLDHRKQEL